MSAEILRAGVHDKVRAEVEGFLQTRRGECAVDDEEGAAGVSFFCEVGDVEGGAFWINRSFEEDDVSLAEVFWFAFEGQFFQACCAGEESYDTVAAVVAFADRDAAGVEEGESCMEG